MALRSGQKISAIVALVAMMLVVVIAPASADTGTTQISGTGFFEPPACDDPPGEFTDLAVGLEGSLVGCWYIDVTSSRWNSASGVYQEDGVEHFEGCLTGADDRCGTFRTTYRFTARYEPDPGSTQPDPAMQLNGRCQHPLIDGSGTGGFAGATGRLDFKDDVEAGIVVYRGHITLAE
jgi:hypothetical protein